MSAGATARGTNARFSTNARVSGLGFRRAVAALPRITSAPVAKSVAPSAVVTTCGKPGAKAKTRKSAAKRYKVTASGKVRPLACRSRARLRIGRSRVE